MRIRKCARAVIINERNEILLQQFEFRDVVGNKVLWVTPGGGIEENETPAEALKRELYEELGIVVDLLGGPIFQLDVWIEGKQGYFISREIYYHVTIQSDTVLSIEHMTKNEKDTLKGLKWWSKDELQKIDNFAPREILNYI
ncbi:NUDIX domain-containing protein [Geobacillus stearothermophilus]|uniref:NUDIX hydrolase n=1 Tax=Geobacillus stearothermophilus TaxID=1422 RepID=UPI002E1A277E|nr:NUDIX domain-containing protein [Geobacillus stearothermophilus]MED3663700.1 NUDIX domain-containing protein [Geobacillus stearothermophilus]